MSRSSHSSVRLGVWQWAWLIVAGRSEVRVGRGEREEGKEKELELEQMSQNWTHFPLPSQQPLCRGDSRTL